MSHPTTWLKPEIGAKRIGAEEMVPPLYEQLHEMAVHRLASEKVGHTLQPTALVHEAYLRLQQGRLGWYDRTDFLRAAAVAMRRILVDHARGKHRQKRGGSWHRLPLTQVDEQILDDPAELLALHEALDELAQRDSVKAELVKLRFFAGVSLQEAADCLQISLRTAQRHWTFARAWLYRAMATTRDAE